MNPQFRQWSMLIYLALVLALGGASAAGYGTNLVLQLGGAALIGWSLWTAQPGRSTRTGLRLFLIVLAVVAALQFLPLPPGLWTRLPGRDAIAHGYQLAGMPLPWLTLSLDPWGSLQSLVWWIPPLALLVMARDRDAPGTRQLVWVIGAVAYGSAIMAGVQSLSGSGYFYEITNRGNGVGFFANSNHFGTFMLAAIALIGGQWLYDRPLGNHRKQRIKPVYMFGALIAPLVIGILLSNSLACQLLLIPTLGGLALISRPDIRINWLVAGGAGALVAIGMVWLLASGLVSNDLMSKSGTAGISRGEFLANGIRMLRAFGPSGSGLGTFRDIYPWYEDAAKVGTTYVNHAHNDLLELLIETGVFGIGLLAVFFGWLGRTILERWGDSRNENPLAQAATLAIVIVLAHSLVDYPLRTAAVSSLIALCCVIAQRQPDARGALAEDGAGAGRRETLMNI
jgi:O-antigen ligase